MTGTGYPAGAGLDNGAQPRRIREGGISIVTEVPARIDNRKFPPAKMAR